MEKETLEKLEQIYKQYRKGVISIEEHDARIIELVPDAKQRGDWYKSLIERVD